MKKIFAIAAMLLMVMTASAQFKFGVKAGVNVTNMELGSLDKAVGNLSASNNAGFFAGVTAKFTLPIVGLGMDVSALYDQRSSELKGTYKDENTNQEVEMSETVKKQNLVIPINVRYQLLGLGDTGSIYAYTGPQLAFNIGDKGLSSCQEWTMKSSSYSWNFGLGVMAFSHLQVTANYNLGLGSTGDQENITGSATAAVSKALGEMFSSSKSGSWQIGAAYYF